MNANIRQRYTKAPRCPRIDNPQKPAVYNINHIKLPAIPLGSGLFDDRSPKPLQVLAPHELCFWWHSIRRPGKGHKADEHNGARLRLTRCDLFYHGELLCGVGGPQWHYEPATHF